ncbi:hypothetical protein E8E13_008400 [Curvularia kusanoi]|uniref:Xaa-Pro aminopeptidase n=1 Tax=Curvularia kusanoi TaxID=90978 RepID=A0A9P4W9J1_CURKU|nr:hypothetical protein E8E13_008400 [Curvularia kusanoi]
MEAFDGMDLTARMSSVAKEYWVHLDAEGSFEKYPAKQHARRVQEKLGIDEGLIYLAGQPARNNEDSDMPAPFRQRRYFYYLTGCNEPSCHMTYDIQHDTLALFIRRIDPKRVIWNGRGSTLAEALERYDIDEVYYVDELGDAIKEWSSYYGGHGSDIFVLHDGQLPQIPGLHATIDSETLQPAMNAARMIKDEHEISLIREANKISSEAHKKVLANILKFKNEAQVEGLFMDVCISHQAKEQAYDPIAASGPNAGTLHYDANNEDFEDRQLMCLDAGCEYELYASDITRTFPLAESWPSAEAENVYKLVERMQESCIQRLAPGVRYLDLHILAHQIAIDGLLRLGILHNGTREEIYAAGTSKAFFPHGLGHHVGLEVHDVGQAELMSVRRGKVVKQQVPSLFPQDFHMPVFDPALCHAPTDAQSTQLEEGMVVTVEPGIYFSLYALQHFYLPSPIHSRFINKAVLHRYMAVGGVRIEDDILITSKGYENLTTAPKGDAMFDVIRGRRSKTHLKESLRGTASKNEIEPYLFRAPGCPPRTMPFRPQQPKPTQSAKEKEKNRDRHATDDYRQLTEDVSFLRQQLTTLMTTVEALAERRDNAATVVAERTPMSQQVASPSYASTTSQRTGPPRQPQFAGPTRAAFSLNIIENSLNRMGIPSGVQNPANHTSSNSSREASPEATTALAQKLLNSGVEGLLGISDDDIEQLLGIYHEEVASVHPIIETKNLIADAPQIMALVRNPQRMSGHPRLGKKDVHILRLAVATAITHEILGKNPLSDRLVFEVEQDAGRISSETEVDLKDIQIMGMLSLYFCHTEEELFAWRAIGRAARQALEMGLHRKQSLLDNFKDPEERKLAVQVFWVVYEMDRRWSFGTSLSFALNDRDIDTQLPEPGKSYPYLKGMVAYARLCSRVWDALPPYGSLQTIPKETEEYLDFITSNWLQSIPQELQFRHPRLGLAPKSQPRLLHRLRTLMYLRGNHLRTLIHRHHVLAPDNIKANIQSAQMVVDIAKDSIEVLVHLNQSSDIYARQQSVYHYYLLSSLAVLLLAVCHAPSMFAESSRDTFVSAVELVKGFSRHGTASRRLWKSIRGLLPVIKSLGLHSDAGTATTNATNKESGELPSDGTPPPQQEEPASVEMPTMWNDVAFNFDAEPGSMPDIFNIGDELIDLYDAFGTAATTQPVQSAPASDNFGEQGLSVWELGEISRHFQGLI